MTEHARGRSFRASLLTHSLSRCSARIGDLSAHRRSTCTAKAWARAAALCRLGPARTCAGTLLVVFLSACSGAGHDDLQLSIERKDGTYVRLSIEVADTPERLARGLAGRTSLSRDSGMLFVIERRGRGFWMKDVTIPLSVAFIDDCGYVLAILDVEPLSLDLHDIEQAYGFGLEVNRGWFKDANVAAGDLVILPRQLLRPGCP